MDDFRDLTHVFYASLTLGKTYSSNEPHWDGLAIYDSAGADIMDVLKSKDPKYDWVRLKLEAMIEACK